MPSDPTGTKPSGVLTRPAADFFDDHMATGGYGMPSSPTAGFNNYVAVALFNNSSGGYAFKVYAITAAGQVTSSARVFSLYGTNGSFVQNCQPLRPDLGMPYGQIYQQSVTVPVDSDPNPLEFPPLLGIIGSGFPGITTVSPFPLFIVPAGYSLIVVNQRSDLDIAASFWYQVAHE